MELYFFFNFQHDTTITSLLNALQVYNNVAVPYSSSLMIELYNRTTEKMQTIKETSDGSKKGHQYFVRIFYRNDTSTEPYQLQIEGEWAFWLVLIHICHHIIS